MTQLSLSGAAVEFGARTLFRDLTVTVGRGERWGIVGRNGTGKTTLFHVITGAQELTRGTVARAPGLRVAYLEQHRDFGAAATVWEAVAGPFAELLALEQSLLEQTARMGEAGAAATPEMFARYDRDLERFEREGGYTVAARVDAVLDGLGFDPAGSRTRPLGALSGGELGRVGLARQLAAPADLLLLDEPTNHLDLETTRWLEQYLRTTAPTVLVVSHDRAFLESVADHILHFEGETATAYRGGYAAFVEQRLERRLAQQRAFEQQRRVVAREEDYIRRNIAGQNSAQAKGRRTRLARLPRLSAPPGEEERMALRLASGARGGEQVAVLDHVSLAVEGRSLVEDFSATMHRGEVVGLVGPNGAGKSTILRALLGERPAERGTARLGASVVPAHYRQDLAQVPAGLALHEIIHELRPAWGRGAVLAHLARFGFTGDDVQRTAATLSGGERARVALAMIMLSGANFLVLDEPTNHLDVESIEALEDAIEGYDGTVLLVSHDRALLRALTTRVWLLHGRRITDFSDGFAEWEVVSAERARAAETAAAEAEELGRVHERARTHAAERARSGERGAVRAARRAVDDAEKLVERYEREASALETALEDPSRYTTAAGGREAARLGAELAAVRARLDAALAEWERATTALAALAGAEPVAAR